jgi:hypothetical protein
MGIIGSHSGPYLCTPDTSSTPNWQRRELAPWQATSAFPGTDPPCCAKIRDEGEHMCCRLPTVRAITPTIGVHHEC